MKTSRMILTILFVVVHLILGTTNLLSQSSNN